MSQRTTTVILSLVLSLMTAMWLPAQERGNVRSRAENHKFGVFQQKEGMNYGHWVFKPVYDQVWVPSTKVAVIKHEGKVGVASILREEMITGMEFDDVDLSIGMASDEECSPLALARKDASGEKRWGLWAFRDNAKPEAHRIEQVLGEDYEAMSVYPDTYVGYAYVLVTKDGRKGLVDAEGRTLIPVEYKHLTMLGKVGTHVCAVASREGGSLFGVLEVADRKVIVKVPLEYDQVQIYSTGIILTREGKKSLLSPEGKTLLQEGYDDILALRNECFKFSTQGKWGLLGYEGGVSSQALWDDIHLYQPNKLLFATAGLNVPQVLDNDRAVRVTRDGLSGLMEAGTGRMLVPPTLESDGTLDFAALRYSKESFHEWKEREKEALLTTRQKGESRREFERRSKDQDLNEAYAAAHMSPNPEKDFMAWSIKNSDVPFGFRLGEYDEETGSFILTNPATPRHSYRLTVPSNEAEAFRSAFSRMASESLPQTRCCVKDDAFCIQEAEFTLSDGQSYVLRTEGTDALVSCSFAELN